MQYLTKENFFALVTMLYGIASFVAVVAPKGSKVGVFAAKWGAALKDHTSPPETK